MSDDDRITLSNLAQVVFVACVIAAVLWLIISSALKHSRPTVKTNPDGPGRYKIVGVDKSSKADKTWHTEATSRENAKVKAELEGIIVTDIAKE